MTSIIAKWQKAKSASFVNYDYTTCGRAALTVLRVIRGSSTSYSRDPLPSKKCALIVLAGREALLASRGPLGKEDGVDVGEDSASSDGNAAEELVELLVVLDGKGDVAGGDAGLLVVAGGVAGELEDLGAQVLEDGGEVDGGAGAHAGGILALAEVAADTADGELQAGLGAAAGGLLGAAATLSFS